MSPNCVSHHKCEPHDEVKARPQTGAQPPANLKGHHSDNATYLSLIRYMPKKRFCGGVQAEGEAADLVVHQAHDFLERPLPEPGAVQQRLHPGEAPPQHVLNHGVRVVQILLCTPAM